MCFLSMPEWVLCCLPFPAIKDMNSGNHPLSHNEIIELFEFFVELNLPAKDLLLLLCDLTLFLCLLVA